MSLLGCRSRILLSVLAALVALAPIAMTQFAPQIHGKIADPDPSPQKSWGTQVTSLGDLAIVGRPKGTPTDGAVYIVAKGDAGWQTSTILAKLTASDPAPSFGANVAAAGDTIVVTAQGAAYVFVKPAGGWSDMTQTAKLTRTAPGRQTYFGRSVAIDGDVIILGDSADNSGTGAVFVFEKPPTGWADAVESAKVTPSVGGGYAAQSVAISGDTIVAGAPFASAGGRLRGAAYVFVKGSTGWTSATQVAQLTGSDIQDEDQLGGVVSIQGDTIVLPNSSADGGAVDSGAAYLYVKPSTGWVSTTETAKLTASDAVQRDAFGQSVAMQGDVVLVGAPGASSTGPNYGTVYVFVKPSTGWTTTTETDRIGGRETFGVFGHAVAFTGDTVVVGAPLANARSGEVFIAKWTTLTESGATNTGGQRVLDLAAPLAANRTYQVGTALGDGPHFIGERAVGLDLDAVWFTSVVVAAPTVFVDYAGTLDTNGDAQAAINIPNLQSIVGLNIYSAFITLDPNAPDGVFGISNTTSFTITQ